MDLQPLASESAWDAVRLIFRNCVSDTPNTEAPHVIAGLSPVRTNPPTLAPALLRRLYACSRGATDAIRFL
eukprot:5339353-Karenia_brevis.AAC.2